MGYIIWSLYLQVHQRYTDKLFRVKTTFTRHSRRYQAEEQPSSPAKSLKRIYHQFKLNIVSAWCLNMMDPMYQRELTSTTIRNSWNQLLTSYHWCSSSCSLFPKACKIYFNKLLLSNWLFYFILYSTVCVIVKSLSSKRPCRRGRIMGKNA